MPKKVKLKSLIEFPRNCYRNVVKLVTGRRSKARRRSGSRQRSKSPHHTRHAQHHHHTTNINHNNHMFKENSLNHEYNNLNYTSIIKPSSTTTTINPKNYETIKSHVAISNKINNTTTTKTTKTTTTNAAQIEQLNSYHIIKEDENETFYDALEITSNDIYLDCDSYDDFLLTNNIDEQDEELMLNSDTNNDKMIYNDEPYEEEDVDLSQQKGLITHFLGQIKIGMDLEKVTMPAFILESRSLLEMYADFFIYTHLFLDIVKQPTAHDRMKQVVRWYMSTFRACRKSSLVKKPYNPILGETFQCWYNLDNNEQCGTAQNKLKYVSEQVSHHPPVSAFYVEYPEQKMQLEGHNWSRIRFLGFYVFIEMTGRTVLKLLEHGEEYVFQFPNAYTRSILTSKH